MENKTKCCNKYSKKLVTYGRIISLLKKCPEGISAKTIAKALKLQYSTTRGYLRELYNKGKIFQKSKNAHYFATNPIHGITNYIYNIINNKYKFHNIYLSFQFKDLEVKSHRDKIQIENIKLTIYFGSKSKKVTCNVSSKQPLTLRELVLVKTLFEQKVKERLDIKELPQLFIKSIEFNQDFQGIRMDGMNAITWNNFKGILEKIYNKENCVRHEFKVSLPIEAKSIIHLLRKGMDSYNLLRAYNSIDERLKRLEEINRRILRSVIFIHSRMPRE